MRWKRKKQQSEQMRGTRSPNSPPQLPFPSINLSFVSLSLFLSHQAVVAERGRIPTDTICRIPSCILPWASSSLSKLPCNISGPSLSCEFLVSVFFPSFFHMVNVFEIFSGCFNFIQTDLRKEDLS